MCTLITRALHPQKQSRKEAFKGESKQGCKNETAFSGDRIPEKAVFQTSSPHMTWSFGATPRGPCIAVNDLVIRRFSGRYLYPVVLLSAPVLYSGDFNRSEPDAGNAEASLEL